jgi:hypothetical protein
MKMVKAAGALMLVALAIPGAASAHVGSATVSCTAADFQFSRFAAGSNTVHYAVKVDNAIAAHGDFVLDQSSGSAGALHVPLTIYGAHTVSAYAWWGPGGTAIGEVGGSEVVPMASGPVSCAAAPPPPPAPVAPAPAAAAAPAAPAPQGAVEGVQVTSPARIARLGAQSSCTDRAVRVTVNGRQMRDVAFSINGRHVRTVTVRAGARSLKAALPMRNRRAAQVVTARVRFRNGAAPRTLSARAPRCAQVAVQPQFTG